MKNPLLVVVIVISVIFSSAISCYKSDANTAINNNEDNMKSIQITIKVGTKCFTAALLDNNTVKSFKQMLPLSINMIELNGNEKYYDLPNSLPVNASNPGTIQNGDLMLYGTTTLVLFYKTFPTSYSYTKLGSIEDISGLVEVLGSGNVTVTFELKSK